VTTFRTYRDATASTASVDRTEGDDYSARKRCIDVPASVTIWPGT